MPNPFRVVQNTIQHHQTTNAVIATLKEAKKECRNMSHFATKGAELATALAEAIKTKMQTTDSSQIDPFTQQAREHVTELEKISTAFTEHSETMRDCKRAAAEKIRVIRAARGTHNTMVALNLAVSPVLPAHLAIVAVSAPAYAKIGKDASLSRSSSLISEITEALQKTEPAWNGSLTGKIKTIADRYEASPTLTALSSELDAEQEKLDNAETSPFIDTLRDSYERVKEYKKNAGLENDHQDKISKLESALNDIKSSGRHSHATLNVFRRRDPQHLMRQMAHVVSRVERQEIKDTIREENLDKTERLACQEIPEVPRLV